MYDIRVYYIIIWSLPPKPVYRMIFAFRQAREQYAFRINYKNHFDRYSVKYIYTYMISRKSDLLESAGKFGTTRYLWYYCTLLTDYTRLFYLFSIVFRFALSVKWAISLNSNLTYQYNILHWLTYSIRNRYIRRHLPRNRASVTYLPHIRLFFCNLYGIIGIPAS